MRCARLLLAAMLVSGALTSAAHACTSGNVRTYFSHQRLEPEEGGVLLRVSIVDVDASQTTVNARLQQPFAHLARDSMVSILLPEYASGGNCVEMGPIEGLVYVTGVPHRAASGHLTLEARAVARPPRRRTQARDYCKYIVDPTYLPPLCVQR
jgi:hypothetical protein